MLLNRLKATNRTIQVALPTARAFIGHTENFKYGGHTSTRWEAGQVDGWLSSPITRQILMKRVLLFCRSRTRHPTRYQAIYKRCRAVNVFFWKLVTHSYVAPELWKLKLICMQNPCQPSVLVEGNVRNLS